MRQLANPISKRSAKQAADDDETTSDALDSDVREALLERNAGHVKTLTARRRPRHASLRAHLPLAIALFVGIVVGFVSFNLFDKGMTDLSAAISAARQAKQNALALVDGVGDDTVITRVDKDAFQLRLMTFNLRYGTASDGPNSWQYRRAHAADVVNRYSPAIFGTQEGLEEQLAELQSLLSRPYERYGLPREKNGEHVQIFYDKSVVERLDGGTFWLSETPDVPGSRGWDAVCVRIATWCRFRLLATRQEFYFVNTHLDSQGHIARFEGAKVVWNEMQKVLARDRLSDATPLFLTGDFNTFRPSNAYQFLTKDSAGPLLHDSWVVAEHKIGNISCTFHEFLGPAYDTKPHDDWDDPDMDRLNRVGTNHIDFILSRPKLPTLISEVITEAWNKRYPSDHYPVFSTVLFPSAVDFPPPAVAHTIDRIDELRP